MSEDERQLLERARGGDVEGLSNEEVAATLEISFAAAKSRLHRARMTLRERLDRSGGVPAD